jgi:hypothetical protein
MITALMIAHISKPNLELFGEVMDVPIPMPKMNKAPIIAINILGLIVNSPILIGLIFMILG